MVRHKVRIRFRKAGDLRLISHHDLMRCFERMLRRASLPFASSEGFNPRPRLVFALSLALGLVGRDEVAELELTEDLSPEEIHSRLTTQAPPGLEVLSVRAIDPKAKAQPRLVTYRVAVPAERLGGLAERVDALLALPECWVERTRPQARRFDLRPYLAGVRLVPGAIEIDIRVTPNGTARPEEVLALVGLGDLPESGAVVERTRLEVEDETPAPPAGGTS